MWPELSGREDETGIDMEIQKRVDTDNSDLITFERLLYFL
jgi:hypothetical protein